MQPAAKADEEPPLGAGQPFAHSAYARPPDVSRSVTRAPEVPTWDQVVPPLPVAHSSGPKAQP